MTRVADLTALNKPHNHQAHDRLEPDTVAPAETPHHDDRLLSAAPVLLREGTS